MQNIATRKEVMKKIIEEDYCESGALIYLLITTGKLDKVIRRLDDTKTIPNTTCMVKKGYLTSEEQFIDVLEHIISRFNSDFWFLRKHGNTFIECILTRKETLPLLFSKNYIGDNSFIPYYTLEFKKACIISFYTILNSIKNSDIINMFLKDNQIELEHFNMNDIKNVDSLYQALRLLCLCNCNSFGLLYIFDGSIIETNKNMYCMQLEMIIEKTYKIKNVATNFLEAIY